MDVEFDKIFNYEYIRAKKLHNDSYLEDLTGLIAKTASLVNCSGEYLFSKEYYLDQHRLEPNHNFEDFINAFKKTFDFGSANKIYIIRGIAGVGKTAFFEHGVQMLTRDSHNTKYIPLKVEFKNIDQKQKISYYEDNIYNQLFKNAIDCIRKLDEESKKNFKTEYDNFTFGFEDTPDAKLFPLKYFCKYIYSKYNRPCIIVFDNIDLSCVETQKNVFKATSNVFARINSFMSYEDMNNQYRVYFAMRPETHLHSEEMPIGNAINFPLPNIKLISLTIIKKTMTKIANEYDRNKTFKCEVTFYSIIENKKITVKKYAEVAHYFIKIFEHFFDDIWNNEEIIKRLGSNEEFHCDLVNYNIRAFLSFLSDTIYHGGFKPLTKEFNDSYSTNHYSVFDYIEMLIRGRWIAHPGNKYIDGEGGNQAPIVFNIFDSSLWDDISNNRIKHFMLYIRILQYFNFDKDEFKTYYTLKKQLNPFFDENHIYRAIQALTFVRILYSHYEGDENIASKKEYDQVYIDDYTKFKLSPMGEFYMEKLFCEFEYIYQMALSSLMPIEYVDELKSCWNKQKEKVVLRFLEGVFWIIKDNLESYDKDTIRKFKLIFCRNNEIQCKPFRRMLDAFIDVMNNKIQRARKNGIKNLDNLIEVLQKAEALKEEAREYFKIILGD